MSFQTILLKKIEAFYEELADVCTACGRKTDDIQVLFATKYLNKDEFNIFVHSVISLNTRKVLIGENRVQDALEKFEYTTFAGHAPYENFSEVGKTFLRTSQTHLGHFEVSTQTGGRAQKAYLPAKFSTIFIGNLQKNKINKAIELFDEIYSIDSVGLARELNKRLEKAGKSMPVFLEVNVSGEETKHGVKPEEVDQIMSTKLQFRNVTINGLMTMAPFTNDQNIIRDVFRKLKTLADRYGLQTSMGMSHDWKIAVEQGSDIIRIGSKIFS